MTEPVRPWRDYAAEEWERITADPLTADEEPWYGVLRQADADAARVPHAEAAASLASILRRVADSAGIDR